ncbi:MAG: hypothetical protein ABMA64_14190 [Myxococcota bacterium]
MRVLWMCLVAGCASGELLPVVAEDGALAGAYDRAAASLTLEVEGSWVVTPTETVPLEQGVATVALEPGDELELLDAAGDPVGWLVVEEPDAAWAEQDVSSRYAGCGSLM